MASIHTHSSGRSPFWFAKYMGEDGKPKFRSTKVKRAEPQSRSKAMTIALGWERAAGRARAGDLTKAQCLTVLNEILGAVSDQTLIAESTEKYLREWLKANGSERYTATINKFLTSLAQKAAKPITAVAPVDIE